MRAGRMILTGDAAFVVRPHTAASTEKAAADAIGLLQALASEKDLDDALTLWERLRLSEGRSLVDYGIAPGDRLGLDNATNGDHL